MDEKQFRKHLADLAHGHHHPEEHDWEQSTPRKSTGQAPAKSAPSKPARKRSRKK